jgi:hypothetical protein
VGPRAGIDMVVMRKISPPTPVVILTWLASLKKVYKLLTFISNYIEADTKSPPPKKKNQ